METKRSAADKVRPILEAMERSIDSARRKRLGDHDDEPALRSNGQPAPERAAHGDAVNRAPARPPQPSSPAPPPGVSENGDEPPRLKARPKRPSGYTHFGDTSVQSRAS